MSRDYWEAHAEFIAAQGIYTGRWFDPKFDKNAKENLEDAERKDNRLWSKAAADTVVMACKGQSGNVSEESKPTQMSPPLFDLTSLQREANARFGFSAKNTLGLAQALYEKRKVLTYPRTDSKALPEDYVNTVKQTVELLKRNKTTTPVLPSRLRKTTGSANTKRTSEFLTMPKFRITLRLSRLCKPRKACQNPNKNSTIWWSNALWRCSSHLQNLWSPRASLKYRGIILKPKDAC